MCSDLEDLRAANQENTSTNEELSNRSKAMIDLNLKLQLSASKAQVKTIDLELRRLESEEAKEHLQMVQVCPGLQPLLSLRIFQQI